MEFKIQNKMVGAGHPLFFIAEAGVNHNGSIDVGKKLIDIAAHAGADAVKFQTFKASELNTKTAPKSTYHIETTGNDEEQSWYELLKTQEISLEMHKVLMEYCQEKRIIFLSTPYGFESADLLDSIGVPAYKIASTDTNNIPLLEYIAKKGKPMILSSAMTTMQEVSDAIFAVRNAGLLDMALLQCTGNYPAKLESSNLKVMNTYKKEFGCVVGYSDHTEEITNAIAATAMGAKIFEKHFTIDKNMPGPDHRMSVDPIELGETISAIRKCEVTLGSDIKKILPEEIENRLKLRKSIVSIVDINEGQAIARGMLGIKRPGGGLEPKEFKNILGRRAKSFIQKDTTLREEMID